LGAELGLGGDAKKCRHFDKGERDRREYDRERVFDDHSFVYLATSRCLAPTGQRVARQRQRREIVAEMGGVPKRVIGRDRQGKEVTPGCFLKECGSG
jgi:hypothetical protein